MAFTRRSGSHARFLIDETDASNAMRSARIVFEDEELPVGGFSAGGQEEYVPGVRGVEISGQAFYTEEWYVLTYPLYINRSSFEVEFQPYGLVDNTRETFYGNGRFYRWEAVEEFGQVVLVDYSIRPADSTGFLANDIT